jgi:hypothetical protein
MERYKAGSAAVGDALAGITDAELDARPEPGEWTPREIVHHVADSEMTAAIRLRRLLAEDNPTIQGYDQEAFARDLFYDQRPIQASLDALAASRPRRRRSSTASPTSSGPAAGPTRRAVPTAWRGGWRSTPATRTTMPRRSSEPVR